MKNVFFALTFCGLLGVFYLINQPPNRGKTPTEALETCVNAVKNSDMKTFSDYVIDGDQFWKEWKKADETERAFARTMLPMLLGGMTMFRYEITKQEIEGDSAMLWVEIDNYTEMDETREIVMRKDGSRWKLEITENY